MTALLEANTISKKFCSRLQSAMRYGLMDIVNQIRGKQNCSLRRDEFWALKNVCLCLKPGESVGVLGNNGAGKSTLLKVLSGQLTPTLGSVTTESRALALTQLGLGFDPVLTGRENIFISAAALGLSRRETQQILDRVLEFASIGDFIDAPLQTYSDGMRARLGYAVAVHVPSEILLLDEILAVGDLEFRRKCWRHLHRYVADGGSVVVVSHDLYGIQALCSRCLILDKGEVVFEGPTTEAMQRYLEIARETTADATSSKETASSQSQTGEATAKASQRTRQMSIESIDIVPANGQLELRTGCEARIRLRYCSQSSFDDVKWGFMLLTPDLSVNIVSGIQPEGTARISCPPGEGMLECRIPRLLLQPGKYALRGCLADGATGASLATSGFVDAPYGFTVTNSASKESNIQQFIGDLVAMDVEWL